MTNYAALKFAAEVVDDLERMRKANVSRLSHLIRGEADSDGELRGLGLPEDCPEVVAMARLVSALRQLEADAIKELERVAKAHPLGPWLEAQRGVGFKQGARLLAAIGDPYMRPEIELEDGTVEKARPRLVSELWAYSGYSVVDGEAQRKRKGAVVNWNPDARQRAYLIATSCVKQPKGTKWRDVYDRAREKYADAVHAVPCARCGPSGKPAQPGTPLRRGHQHARALRVTSKEILKELWIESKRLHEGGE